MKKLSISIAKAWLVGILSFIFDIALIIIFIFGYDLYYLKAITIAFILSTGYSYVLAKTYVFHESKSEIYRGVIYFYCFALIALVIILFLTYMIVNIFQIDPILARIIVSLFEGIWNFITNYFFTFKAHKFQFNK